MHVLWLIPDYYSFLVEELEALARVVPRVSVLTQASRVAVEGVETVAIGPLRRTPTHVAARMMEATRVVLDAPGRLARGNAAFLARWNDETRRYVRAERVDVIHSHFATPRGTAGRMARCGRPVVVTLRGVEALTVPEIGYGYSLDGAFRAELRRTLRAADAVTVASELARRAAADLAGDDVSVQVIPNGVDTERFAGGDRAAGRRALGVDEGRPLLLAIGHLTPRKAFDDLVRALAIVARDRPDVMLAIIGKGEEEQRLGDLAREQGVEQAVRLPGVVSREAIADCFAACDALVHPALCDAFGNVVLEAMAAGRPVVATTATGAAVDLIDDGVSGVLVPPRDPGAIAAAVTRLLADPAGAARLGGAGRLVAGKHTLRARAEAFSDIYTRVAAYSAAPAGAAVL